MLEPSIAPEMSCSSTEAYVFKCHLKQIDTMFWNGLPHSYQIFWRPVNQTELYQLNNTDVNQWNLTT